MERIEKGDGRWYVNDSFLRDEILNSDSIGSNVVNILKTVWVAQRHPNSFCGTSGKNNLNQWGGKTSNNQN